MNQNQALSLMESDAFLSCIEKNTKMGTSQRLRTKKEFKETDDAYGLKGNALSRAYNRYIKTSGSALTDAAINYLVKEKPPMKMGRVSKNLVSMTFVRPEALVDKPDRGRNISTKQIVETVRTMSEADKAALRKELG